MYRYIEGGTEAEVTVRANRAAFDDVKFLPRVAVGSREPDLRTTVLGQELSMPIVLAPAGYIRLAHRTGEIGAARAAGRAGTAVGISTFSSHDIIDIAANATGPVWYQLYFGGGRVGAEVAIDRARAAGCKALIVSVDLAARAARERALRGGQIPTGVTLKRRWHTHPKCCRALDGFSTSCVTG